MDRNEKEFEEWLAGASLTGDQLEEYRKVNHEFDTGVEDAKLIIL